MEKPVHPSLPLAVRDMIGKVSFTETSPVAAEASAFCLFANAVEDSNPLYRNPALAEIMAGGLVCPPPLLSAWNRPDPWRPDNARRVRPLELHFRVKDALNLPKAVVVSSEMALAAPIRAGDYVIEQQCLERVGEIRQNQLGAGRNWVISVMYRRQSDQQLFGTETLSFFGYGGDA